MGKLAVSDCQGGDKAICEEKVSESFSLRGYGDSCRRRAFSGVYAAVLSAFSGDAIY